MKVKEPPYTAEEEADYFRRNCGGPVAVTSMTRGRGTLGMRPAPPAVLVTSVRALTPSLPLLPLTAEDIRVGWGSPQRPRSCLAQASSPPQ